MLVSSGQTEVLEQLKGECSALGTVPWLAGTQREQVADLHPRCPSFQLFRLTSVASTT